MHIIRFCFVRQGCSWCFGYCGVAGRVYALIRDSISPWYHITQTKLDNTLSQEEISYCKWISKIRINVGKSFLFRPRNDSFESYCNINQFIELKYNKLRAITLQWKWAYYNTYSFTIYYNSNINLMTKQNKCAKCFYR